MSWISGASVGWAISKYYQPLASSHIAYYIDASFCQLALPHFHEDSLLSWQHFGCEDLQTMLRKAFDVWEHNSAVSFDETFDRTRASLVVDVDEGYGYDSDTIAYYTGPLPTIPNSTAMIRLHPDRCWYTDHEFCYIVHRHYDLFIGGLVTMFTASLLFLGFVVCQTSTRRIDSVLRLIVWTLVFTPPLVYVSTVRPCEQCHDFMMVLMHEVGHALGLHHPDVVSSDLQHRCGCKENAVLTLDFPELCTAIVNPESIMFSTAPHRAMACLSRDDVDAVRTLYGGACDEHVRCYQVVHVASLSRIAIALVYSFVFSWGVVVLRNLAGRAWRRRRGSGVRIRTRTTYVAPVRAAPVRAAPVSHPRRAPSTAFPPRPASTPASRPASRPSRSSSLPPLRPSRAVVQPSASARSQGLAPSAASRSRFTRV